MEFFLLVIIFSFQLYVAQGFYVIQKDLCKSSILISNGKSEYQGTVCDNIKEDTLHVTLNKLHGNHTSYRQPLTKKTVERKYELNLVNARLDNTEVLLKMLKTFEAYLKCSNHASSLSSAKCHVPQSNCMLGNSANKIGILMEEFIVTPSIYGLACVDFGGVDDHVQVRSRRSNSDQADDKQKNFCCGKLLEKQFICHGCKHVVKNGTTVDIGITTKKCKVKGFKCLGGQTIGGNTGGNKQRIIIKHTASEPIAQRTRRSLREDKKMGQAKTIQRNMHINIIYKALIFLVKQFTF